jgi:hypothetical protein
MTTDATEITWVHTDYVFTHMLVPGVGIVTFDGVHWRDANGKVHEVVVKDGDTITLEGTVTLT